MDIVLDQENKITKFPPIFSEELKEGSRTLLKHYAELLLTLASCHARE